MSVILGVEETRGLVFEGHDTYGAHLIWPAPLLTSAQLVDSSANDFSGTNTGSIVTYYFREDMFDPVSRIRRGRFYKFSGTKGAQWYVFPFPHVIVPQVKTNDDGLICVPSLGEYRSCAISAELGNLGISHPVVVLGKGKSSTIWSVIHAETGFTGEELVTLKARQSMGALPDVNWKKVPKEAIATLREKLDVLEDDYHRAGVESVVDRAREAATAILSGYLQGEGISAAKGKDLGKLIELLVEQSGRRARRVIACAAEIPARLHSRAKHAEQEAREIRPLREQDAELAVQCIGVMLCDLGWAEWG